MFYLIWIISAFAAVGLGLWATKKLDSKNQDNAKQGTPRNNKKK